MKKIPHFCIMLAMLLLMSGCFLRKKNKCMDCPKWGHQTEKTAEEVNC